VIFSLEILEKNNESILILVIYWKKISIASAMVRHDLWTLVVKPLGITLKKAVEKSRNRKIKKKYVLC
jgi:hypothetical protein